MSIVYLKFFLFFNEMNVFNSVTSYIISLGNLCLELAVQALSHTFGTCTAE